MKGNTGYQPTEPVKGGPPNRGSSVQKNLNELRKVAGKKLGELQNPNHEYTLQTTTHCPDNELWTDINNSGDGIQKYTVRFRTNDEATFHAIEDYCRELLSLRSKIEYCKKILES